MSAVCAEIANTGRTNLEKRADHIKEISHTANESPICFVINQHNLVLLVHLFSSFNKIANIWGKQFFTPACCMHNRL